MLLFGLCSGKNKFHCGIEFIQKRIHSKKTLYIQILCTNHKINLIFDCMSKSMAEIQYFSRSGVSSFGGFVFVTSYYFCFKFDLRGDQSGPARWLRPFHGRYHARTAAMSACGSSPGWSSAPKPTIRSG